MKIPQTPPDPNAFITALVKEHPGRLNVLMAASSPTDSKGRYLHWDELRFKKPPGSLSPEEWWAATRVARRIASQSLPLFDSYGKQFSFCELPPLKAALREFDMNAGGALASDATALTSGEGRLYLRRSLAEEPFASSLIEGAATTRQIAKKLIFEGREPRTKDERMVINNYRALEFVKSHKDDNLTVEMLLELHRIVTAGTLDKATDEGRLRTTDDVQVVDDTSGEILHQPPPADAIPKRLGDLIAFANSAVDPSQWIHPLVKAFVLHFMLSYEHPFVDGNGRVARALFYWYALRGNYWLLEYVSISAIIAESVISYGRSFLYVETDGADLTYFLLYHAKILSDALDRLVKYANRRRDEVTLFEERLQDRARKDSLNHRQSWILNDFARNRLGSIRIADHAAQHSVSYLTARNDLEELTGIGLLKKVKSGRISIYLAAPNLIKKLTTAAPLPVA